LFLFRALLGIGMGAEWPAGAALAMESWPARSRGFMSGALQGSWGLGFLLSSAAYGLLFNMIGWRGLLWLGVLPALVTLYIRKFVKEPEVWRENREKQRQQGKEFKAPLLEISQITTVGRQSMMGDRQVQQDSLFYEFSFERHVPERHLLRAIDRFVDLGGVRAYLAPFYSETGRPSIDPELLIRMLIVGYCFGIRSERRLCEEVHLNLAYRWFCRLGLVV
jgi:MFS family permease